MSTLALGRRPAPPDVVAIVRRLVEAQGVSAAARQLGVASLDAYADALATIERAQGEYDTLTKLVPHLLLGYLAAFVRHASRMGVLRAWRRPAP
ncbi:MAG TPA: hypothetical protein VGG39_01850 [Polyangiaceae bacterium]|jgi:hypothetical protein